MDKILRLPSTELTIDYSRKMAKISFIGDIRFDDYKEALLSAAELVRSQGVENIIMDRTRIEKLDAECRVWVKNEYLKVHIKPLIPKLNKVAVVDSASIVGQIYGKAIYKTLSLVYPSLTFKFFSKLDKAINWFEPGMVTERKLVTQEKKVNNGSLVVGDRVHSNRKPVQTPGSEVNKRNIIAANEKKSQKAVVAEKQISEKAKTSLFDKIFNALFPKFD
ncbi:MAG: hypothetical protein AAFQ94_07560 [Bacteroidota bacterium]